MNASMAASAKALAKASKSAIGFIVHLEPAGRQGTCVSWMDASPYLGNVGLSTVARAGGIGLPIPKNVKAGEGSPSPAFKGVMPGETVRPSLRRPPGG
jgi:hypothetical protein